LYPLTYLQTDPNPEIKRTCRADLSPVPGAAWDEFYAWTVRRRGAPLYQIRHHLGRCHTFHQRLGWHAYQEVPDAPQDVLLRRWQSKDRLPEARILGVDPLPGQAGPHRLPAHDRGAQAPAAGR
jgi:hypothetical protein